MKRIVIPGAILRPVDTQNLMTCSPLDSRHDIELWVLSYCTLHAVEATIAFHTSRKAIQHIIVSRGSDACENLITQHTSNGAPGF